MSGLYYTRGYLGAGILLGEVLQSSWLTQAFLKIAVKGSGAKYGVAVDLHPRRHSPPSAAGPFYGLELECMERCGCTSGNLK